MTTAPIFVTCPKGLEALLADELLSFGLNELKQTVAGVSAVGELQNIYRACLWSRLANKILLPIANVSIESADDMYDAVRAIAWDQYLASNGNFWIDFNGSNDAIRNTQFGAQKVKDGVVDYFRERFGERPSIAKPGNELDLNLNVRLNKQQVVINVDLCGESLHRRGYRVGSVKAPLKENLAAALLFRANWQNLAREGMPLIDPMCGSGTLLLEAAMIAADIAPAHKREFFPFQNLPDFDAALWQELRAEAEQRRVDGLAAMKSEIRGYDDNVLAIRSAEYNIEALGVGEHVHVMVKSLAHFSRPSHGDFSRGLLISNPPYGERLGEVHELVPLYQSLGAVLKEEFVGWQAAVFTGNPELGKTMGLRSHKKYKLFNGAIPCELLLFDVTPQAFVKNNEDGKQQGKNSSNGLALSEGARMVANRLQKNQRQLAKWAEQEGIDCYRVYDADLPEYAAAVDLYHDTLHIQEYAAPKSIPDEKASQRLDDLICAVAETFAVPVNNISVKQRRRTKGKSQYERLSDDPFATMMEVREGPARLAVNLWAYLDTGLFLDHRPVRRRIAELAQGKRFLNLFCYTASATVHAAIGPSGKKGAKASVSVDMSRTYLQWARRNFQLNGINEKHHELVQADCLTWLENCREGFDVIMLDPPSFSNSKRMEGVLDVQRDHVSMIQRCRELLLPGGTLVFSTNLRRFKLDESLSARYEVEDISSATIDKDFQRNPKIHQCFLLRHSKRV